MSAGWDGQELLQPVAVDAPCGENLEDTAQLASIEASRLFGRARPFDAPPDPDDRWRPPDWLEFRQATLDALARSRDLRVLANLGVALLRTDGIAAFLRTIPVAAHWLETYWADAFPRLDDGDATLRRSALNCFADSMAVIDALRRLPLVSSRQHGTFSLRDIDIATGQQQPRAGEAKTDEAQINAAFADTPVDELADLQRALSGALGAVRQIDVAMGTQAGPEAVPALDALTAPLGRIDRVLRAHLATRTGAPDGEVVPDGIVTGNGNARGGPIGAIESREDAIRALDAVAEFFRRTEPSSPVPLFVERARRLVSKSFLEVLADMAPDAVPHVRAVGGVQEG
jgi:type VI secretion system protein ImpA